MPHIRKGDRKIKSSASPLMVRLDKRSKSVLAKAASLRRISVSDYVRTVMVAQAERELEGAKSQVIVLSPDEQLSFWKALNEPPVLTAAQRKLGATMRGKS